MSRTVVKMASLAAAVACVVGLAAPAQITKMSLELQPLAPFRALIRRSPPAVKSVVLPGRNSSEITRPPTPCSAVLKAAAPSCPKA